jgi:hypothetical protein
VLPLRYLLEPLNLGAGFVNVVLRLLQHLFAHHDAPPNLHDVVERAPCLF